jgi:hypothetical protein
MRAVANETQEGVPSTIAIPVPQPRTQARAEPRPRAQARARALVWVALGAVAAAAAAAPLWSSHFLPFQDAPQHLAAIRVIADYRTPGLGFDKWFVIDLRRLQYLGFYLPAAGLARVVGPQAACRLLLTLIAFAYPLSAWMLLAAFGRDLRLAVVAPAAFHSTPLYLGFFNFVASVPATVAVVALAERELRAPRLGRALVLAAFAAALLWLHPSALALAIGAAVLLAITSGESAARIARALAPFLPSVALLGAWAAQALASRDGVGAAGRALPRWLGPREQVLDLLRFGNVLRGHGDEVFVAATALLCLAAILVPLPDRAKRDWRLPLLAVSTFAVYLMLPADLGFMGFIHVRAIPFLALAVLASPLIAEGRATGAILATVVAVQIAYAGVLARAYRRFDREAEAPQLSQVLQAAEPGRSLFALIYDQSSGTVQGRPYLHFGAYYEVDRGGRARTNFAETPWTPVRYRPETAPAELPRGWENEPESIDPGMAAADDDYLLVRGPGPDPGPRFAQRAHAGRWTLYERAARYRAASRN